MQRQRASVPLDSLIEDEVWQEAFTRREPARQRPRRLHAVEGGRSPSQRMAAAAPPEPPRPAPAREVPPPVADPRTAAARRPSGRVAPPASASATAGEPARRTVTIRGYGAERNLPWPDSPHRRPQRSIHERAGFNPDRVAMWAVLLGILLVIVALAS
jgi:hypothetical protein